MKIAIVTGGSGGIGREFLKQIPTFMPGLGEIWVLARNTRRMYTLSQACAVPIRVIRADLADENGLSFFETALKACRPEIWMLVNCAGFGKAGSFVKIAKSEPGVQSEMVRVNCEALTMITELCIPYMNYGARIINVASAAAFCPQYDFAVYSATKSYVLNFSRALREELLAHEIYVTCVCPGAVDTAFFIRSGEKKNRLKKMRKANPKRVVRRALIDSSLKRSVSVYGFGMRALRIPAKLLPHGLLLKLFHYFA